jgi:hypothetical protein
VYRRGIPHETLVQVPITFQQTDGPRPKGLSTQGFRTTTNAAGIGLLFGGKVQPTGAEDVVGNVVINLPAPLRTVHRAVHIPARVEFREAAALQIFGAGPSLEYQLLVKTRADSFGVGGVRVDFQRTAGISVTPTSWSATTDAAGRMVLPMRANEAGVVIGNLTITPPTPWKAYSLDSVAFPTFDADSQIVYATLRVGPALSYYVVVRRNGIPLPGVDVEFQRTGGVNVNPSHFASTTDNDGIAVLAPTPAAEGSVTADVTVHSPAPYTPFVVRGLSLVAVDGDVPNGRTLLGDWDVASPPTALRAP